jgi:hypothetical protein
MYDNLELYNFRRNCSTSLIIIRGADSQSICMLALTKELTVFFNDPPFSDGKNKFILL